jgi:hypothetical protein
LGAEGFEHIAKPPKNRGLTTEAVQNQVQLAQVLAHFEQRGTTQRR